MPWLEPVTLSGPYAQLKPLSHDHVGGLDDYAPTEDSFGALGDVIEVADEVWGGH